VRSKISIFTLTFKCLFMCILCTSVYFCLYFCIIFVYKAQHQVPVLSYMTNIWNTVFSQVCVYKDGQAIIDTAGGVLGKFDPRPVQPDSLFSCFSVTKGITAGLVHWLADQGCVLFLYSMLMAASDMIPYCSVLVFILMVD